jgi:hypothetical protein
MMILYKGRWCFLKSQTPLYILIKRKQVKKLPKDYHMVPQIIKRKQNHIVPHVIPQLITRKQNHMVPRVIPHLITRN